MRDSSTRLTPKEAAGIVGCSTRLIQKYIVDGKLCASREDGKYYIERSEFFRVFPKAHKKEQDSNIAFIQAERERLENENYTLKEIASKKDLEIQFLRQQMEMVSVEKTKMLDTIISYTKLLEHKQAESNRERWTWSGIFRRQR